MSRPSRLLILDDNHSDRDLLREAIQDTGWKAVVEEASSGRQAISTLQRHAVMGTLPDLLLMDYRYHSEQCLDILARIRAIPACASLQIVVFSGSLPPEPHRRACYELGVLKVLVKAETYSDLLAMITVLKRIFTASGDITPGGSWIQADDLAELGDG
jgi:CheY-like chemotaxis protein